MFLKPVQDLFKRHILSSLVFGIIFIFTLASCSNDIPSQDHLGKLSFYNSLNTQSFSFAVSDKLLSGDESVPDKKHPKMTKSQVKILKNLLKKNNYCINKKDELSFKITSKQEKIYDVTFSGLIEQQYNAKSLTPTTYFGKCL